MNTHHDNCPHCHATLPQTPARPLRWAVVGLAWTVTMALVFAGSLLGPTVIFVLPFLITGGMGAITGAHAWAWGDRACGACGKLYELDGERVEAEPIELPVTARLPERLAA